MNLPLSVAQKLLQLQQGARIPAAQLRHSIVNKMVEDGVLHKQRTGSNRNVFFIQQQDGFSDYLHNHFGIGNLEAYIAGYTDNDLTRHEAIHIASDSKLKVIRTFKGFLVNSFEEIAASLNGHAFTVYPTPGTFQFIYDFERFIPGPDVLIVGIENPENFRWIEKQQSLFQDRKSLFISRYPQSQTSDVIRWLKSLPNQYLHFGDFDFEGINIYLREYKKHLAQRASFFVPQSIEAALFSKGNRDLYDAQLHHQPDISAIDETAILQLLNLLHRHKKVLEQEALISS